MLSTASPKHFGAKSAPQWEENRPYPDLSKPSCPPMIDSTHGEKLSFMFYYLDSISDLIH